MGWVNVMLPPFLLILGDANMYQRFMAAESPRTARRAAFGAFAGLLVLESAIIGVALFGRVLLPNAPANPGHVIIEMAFTVFPPVVGLLLAATAVAVIVSTADSYLLACSTTASMDLGGGMTTTFKQRVLVAALLRPRTSARAVVGGMVAGLGTALVWKVLLDAGMLGGGLAQLDPVLPALGANAFVLLVLEVSRKDK